MHEYQSPILSHRVIARSAVAGEFHTCFCVVALLRCWWLRCCCVVVTWRINSALHSFDFRVSHSEHSNLYPFVYLLELRAMPTHHKNSSGHGSRKRRRRLIFGSILPCAAAWRIASQWNGDIGELALANKLPLYLRAIVRDIADPIGEEDEDVAWTTSPVASMMSNFHSPVIEQAVRLHDRYLVDSLTFINKFSAEEYLKRAGFETNQTPDAVIREGKQFTIVVLTQNRRLPYVVALISLLLQGHEEAEYVEMLDVTICNVENRLDRKEHYFLFEDLRKRLSSLMRFEDWSGSFSKHNAPFVRALELCKERKGKWCVVLDDITIPSLGLAQQILATAQVLETEEPELPGIIKLYSLIKSEGDGDAKKFRVHNCERNENGNGTVIADAFSSVVLGDLLGFLRKSNNGKGSMAGIPYCQFLEANGLNRTLVEMNPSIVNHIGLFPDDKTANSHNRIVDGLLPMDPAFELMGERDAPSSRSLDQYEGTLPFGVYPSDAVAREVERHDRYVVDGMLYIDGFGEKEASSYMKYRSSAPKSHPDGKICLVVFTIHRSVPYISVLLSVLLRGHKPKTFMCELEVHVINIERRPGRLPYHMFALLKEKFLFINFEDWSQPYEETAQWQESQDKWYYANQKIDYLRALKLCEQSGSPWCLMLEDDALPRVGVISLFRKLIDKRAFNVSTYTPLIIKELGEAAQQLSKGNIFGNKRKPQKPKEIQDEKRSKAREVQLDEVFIIKLYFNGAGRKPLSSHYSSYYTREAPLDMFEAAAKGEAVQNVQYKLFWSSNNKGAVADCYPRSILGRLIAHVENTTALVGSDAATWPFDAEVNDHFLSATNLKSISASPSLINHLGMVSENLGYAGINPARISTDISFTLDDGSTYNCTICLNGNVAS